MEAHSFLIDIFKSEYARRERKNPRYSLRAFARDLGVPPSRLSEFLSGKAGISSRKLNSIFELLNLSQSQLELAEMAADAAFSKMLDIKERAQARFEAKLRIVQSMGWDQFLYISDWHHTLVFQSLLIDRFQKKPQLILETIPISEDLLFESLKLLERVGLIEVKIVDGEEIFLPIQKTLLVHHSGYSESILRYQTAYFDLWKSRTLNEYGFNWAGRTQVAATSKIALSHFYKELKAFLDAQMINMEKAEPKEVVMAFSAQLSEVVKA